MTKIVHRDVETDYQREDGTPLAHVYAEDLTHWYAVDANGDDLCSAMPSRYDAEAIAHEFAEKAR